MKDTDFHKQIKDKKIHTNECVNEAFVVSSHDFSKKDHPIYNSHVRHKFQVLRGLVSKNQSSKGKKQKDNIKYCQKNIRPK